MPLTWTRIDYDELNSRQKETCSFHRLAAMLAEYGYSSIRLTDDWQGADCIAQHIDGVDWYLYPHDQLLKRVLEVTNIGETTSWKERGGYSFHGLSKVMSGELRKFCIPW